MESLKLAQPNRRLWAVGLAITVGLAMLFLMVLLCGLREPTSARANPGILYVDRTTGQDIGTCGTTSIPCRTISYALNSRASGGDTIRVAQGVYTENLTVDKQVTLEGGYESVAWTRNIDAYKTTIDGGGSTVNQSVVRFEEDSDGAVLDGFTIQNGVAEYGGGIHITGANIVVQDCVVTENVANYKGGGIHVSNSDVLISNTRVLSNEVHNNFGGGIHVAGANAQVEIRDCLVANNRGADFGGGGIVIDWYASATIANSEIISNTCPTPNDGGGGIRVNNHASAEIQDNFIAYNQADSGGGIGVTDHSTASITGNQILSNTVIYGGGGIGVYECRVAIGHNIINWNAARGAAGLDIGGSSADVYANIVAYNRVGDWASAGMSLWGASYVTVTNNIIVSNVGWDGYGIALWNDTTQARLVNNTIAYNSGEGVSAAAASTALVRNNIIVGNNGGIQDMDSQAAITIDHNDVWNNGWANYINVSPGTGDISADPLFVNDAADDLHLRSDSPCIDAGTNAGAPATDFDGDPRPHGKGVDIGADEVILRRVYLPIIAKQHETQVCTPYYEAYFDSPECDWPESDTTDHRFGCINGEFQILLKQPYKNGFVIASILPTSDFVLGADVRFATNNGGAAGLIFGNATTYEFYKFVIWPSPGVFGLYKHNGQALISWRSDAAINTYPGTNHLEVEREGSLIRLYANDHLLATVDDSSIQTTSIGVHSNSDALANVDTRYDNFVAYPLKCADISVSTSPKRQPAVRTSSTTFPMLR